MTSRRQPRGYPPLTGYPGRFYLGFRRNPTNFEPKGFEFDVNRLNRIRFILRAQCTVPLFIGGLVLALGQNLGQRSLAAPRSPHPVAVEGPTSAPNREPSNPGFTPDIGNGPTIARIRRRGYLKVGIQTQVRPLAFGDADRPQGFEVELAQQLALGILGRAEALRFEPLLRRDRLTALTDGRVDLVIAGLTRTNARQRLIRMSIPYYIDGLGILLPRSAQIPPRVNLAQGPIALIQGSESIAVVKTRWPQAQLLAVPSYMAAYQALETGQATAFVGDRSLLIGWQQDHPQYQTLPDRLSGAPLAVGIAKGQEDLAQAVDRQLVQLKDWLQTTAQRWGLP